MGITYVSRMYGGRASDKFITSDSEDLLQNLESSKGSVMADREVLISGILNDMGVKLHMPSFEGTERTQLTSSETIKSENISKVRIHVERAIQRIKIFHICSDLSCHRWNCLSCRIRFISCMVLFTYANNLALCIK